MLTGWNLPRMIFAPFVHPGVILRFLAIFRMVASDSAAGAEGPKYGTFLNLDFVL
jgi:hypothetical protein